MRDICGLLCGGEYPWARGTEDAADRTALLALADKAMFAIKKRGKNAIGITAPDGAGKKPVPGSDAGFAAEKPSATKGRVKK